MSLNLINLSSQAVNYSQRVKTNGHRQHRQTDRQDGNKTTDSLIDRQTDRHWMDRHRMDRQDGCTDN